jgi:hypothetical protein
MGWDYDGSWGHRPAVDALWVTLGESNGSSDPERRWLITGNSHTFRGRFSVRTQIDDEWHYRTIDISDVLDVSPEARIWLDGFLNGYESELYDVAPNAPEISDEDERLWGVFTERLYRSGTSWWGTQNRPPLSPFVLGLSDPTPWCFSIGRWWVVEGSAWVVSDPQPEYITASSDVSDVWPGSPCETSEEGCDMEFAYDVISPDVTLETWYCTVCHNISSVEESKRDA